MEIISEFIKIFTQAATSVVIIAEDTQGNNSYAVNFGVNGRLTREGIATARNKWSPVDLEMIPLETPSDLIETAVSVDSQTRVKIILIPAPALDLPASLLAHFNVFVPNEHVTGYFTGVEEHNLENAHRAAKIVISLGGVNAISPLGGKGEILMEPNRWSLLKPDITRLIAQVIATTVAEMDFSMQLQLHWVKAVL